MVVDTLSEHWLFCNVVVAAPGVAEVQAESALFSKLTWLLAMR
jgi:hypothetical protein